MSSKVKTFFKTQEEVTIRSIPGFQKAKKWEFFLKISDIPEDLALWLDVNPRKATPTEVHTGIINTILNKPREMVIKNAGFILSCEKVTESHEGIAAIFGDRKIHGLIDGNNSRVAIAKAKATALANGDSLEDCYIDITIYTGLTQSEVQDLAEGQNIRKKVQKHSLMNYTGYFDTLRESLGAKRCENIMFHEGDTGTINIQLLLQLMLSLNIERYPEASNRPMTYGYPGKVMQIFKDDWEQDPSPSALLSENAAMIYDAYMLVREAMPDLWRGHKGGNRHWTKSADKYARAIELQFFGALRPLVSWDLQQSEFDWYVEDLKDAIEELGPKLILLIREVFDKAPIHKRGGVVGKDAMLPRVLFVEAQDWINKL